MRPVAAGVVVFKGQVLLVRRRHPEDELVWQFPAGKIEPGETVQQATAREVAEETGLEVVMHTVIGERVHPMTGRHVYYVGCWVFYGDAVVGDEEEIAEIAWVTREQISEYVPYGLYGPVQAWLDVELQRL